MHKTYRGLLSLVCCLLLASAIALPLAAQSTAPQSDINRNRDLSTPAPADQYNTQPATVPDSQPQSDLDREKPSSSDSSQPATSADRDDSSDANRELPKTASGIDLVGLIGAASLLGSAIRRRYF